MFFFFFVHSFISLNNCWVYFIKSDRNDPCMILYKVDSAENRTRWKGIVVKLPYFLAIRQGFLLEGLKITKSVIQGIF